MKNENQNNTVVIYTYRYMWKNTQGKLCVKYLTDTLGAHDRFITTIKKDENVISCMREYVSEVNFAFLGFTEAIKEEKKDEEKKENETIS